MTSYAQETLFGMPEIIEIEQEYRPTQEEINEYYKEHTLLETVRHFHCRPSKLNIDPELKKGRHGAGVDRFSTEVKTVFLKTFTNMSDLKISKHLGLSNKTVAAIGRRNKPLKNLFEEYKVQIGNAYGEHLKETIGFIVKGMDAVLAEALSKKKIKAAEFKELIDGWSKMHANILDCIPHEEVTGGGDVDAKQQLMSALTDAIKSNKMDKETAESIYYQPDEESIPSDEQKNEEEE